MLKQFFLQADKSVENLVTSVEKLREDMIICMKVERRCKTYQANKDVKTRRYRHDRKRLKRRIIGQRAKKYMRVALNSCPKGHFYDNDVANTVDDNESL